HHQDQSADQQFAQHGRDVALFRRLERDKNVAAVRNHHAITTYHAAESPIILVADSDPMPTDDAAATISFHVWSSIAIPCAVRSLRVARSTSPGSNTGAPATAGGDALTHSTNRATSRETMPSQS